ncbi:PPOX class F420-dependent oxidoreductase [Demetria terragena]|uniref:PPOX class F420-dependent oxidoreductase n=1 Tax=Demetria terragena TaxID=63959 RepID=UPI00038154B7|nr:PPOX class F420-dependent oxidoreductase [Demetria terragena]
MHDNSALIGQQQYVQLTTFRRNGIAVPSPVWIASDAGDLLIISVDQTGKTKRLAHTARVELRPCDVRGNVVPGAPTFTGSASVHRDAAAIMRVKKAIGAKYGWWYRAMNLVEPVMERLPGRKPRAAIIVTDVTAVGA